MGNCFSTESHPGHGSHHTSGVPGGPSPGISRMPPEVSVPTLPGNNDIVPMDLGLPRPLPDPTEATPSSIKVSY